MRSPLRRERPNALGREEVLDDRAECGRVGEQVDVAAGVCVWRVACGSSRAMMWALMIGMIGFVGAGDDEGGLADRREGEQARPHRPGEELVQVAAAGSGGQLMPDDLGDVGVAEIRAAAVDGRGDRGQIVAVDEPAGVSIFVRTVGRAGIMRTPVAVATRTSRRHRRGFWKATIT